VTNDGISAALTVAGEAPIKVGRIAQAAAVT
jgi:hypothetical protein